jgi:TonB family protein
VGVLKTQSTLTIAVWSSLLLHTVLFLGFELAFSNKSKPFPKSEPRAVTSVSISSISSPDLSPETTVENIIQDQPLEKKELPSEILEEIPLSELLSEKNNTNNQADKKLFSEDTDYTVKSVESGILAQVNTITEPVPINSLEPDYPFRARKKGLEGVVVLNVVVSNLGEPVSCQISDSSGHKDLDNAALDTVLSSSFYPGTENGENIESTLRISIRFRLNKS